MAVLSAGAGLLIAAAGAVPAYAATQVSPPGGHPGGHVVATVTFQRAAPAASGSGSSPRVILPCVVRSPGSAAGAAPADDTCSSGVVTCRVTASEPYQFSPGGQSIYFDAETYCSEDVPQISMGQDVIHSTPIDPNNPLTDSDVVTNNHIALTANQAVCQPGQYAVNASARITPPAGYVVTGSLHDTSATVTFSASDCPGGGGGGGGGNGGGGGGGCAVPAPALASHLAGRHPDRISCS